jgi:hypothetical protein
LVVCVLVFVLMHISDSIICENCFHDGSSCTRVHLVARMPMCERALFMMRSKAMELSDAPCPHAAVCRN